MNFPKRTDEYSELQAMDSLLTLEPAAIGSTTSRETWPIVYGPVVSRRLGKSLGINLLGSGPKACSYDCLYCDLGFTQIRMRELKEQITFPSLAEIEVAFRDRLQRMRLDDEDFDSIGIVGNGDPLIFPHLEEAIDILVRLRDEIAPQKPLIIMTNGAQIDNRRRAQALNKLDERMIKLDAGNDNLMKRMNNPLVRANVSKVIASVRQLRDTIVQSMFVQGILDNTEAAHIEEWIECVGLIRPKAVHLYSISRIPPMTGLIKVPEDRLDIIAAQLERRTRIKAIVFG